ncbi:MAG: hypothetical protein GX976_05895, partial [Bacteroidales bacterium]|nr:hypothetical protein [Bacteroidales bacterium]
MKTNKILLAVMLTAIPFFGFAQEWDDIYANPTQKERVKAEVKQQEPQKKKVVIVQGDATGMEIQANGRDVDEYNRRSTNDLPAGDEAYENDSLEYEDYQYTDRIVRFHDPESSIKITGADEVIVYVGDDLYENYNNRGWGSNYYFGMGWGMGYYPWYDSWYNPWYYSGWYDPWYGFGSYYGWSRWHSPWYYSRWHSPWYYGGWYDPWYYGYGSYYGYGGYYGYYGYGGGYSHGFYDGYYSSLTQNRSGRSSGIYRRSSANRSSASTTGLASRSSASTRSTLSGRSASSNTRSTLSGRNATSTNRSVAGTPRTRIIDNNGRVLDSRTGRVIDRSGTTSNRSVYGTAPNTRTGNYSTGSSSERTYQRSSTTTGR